MKSIPPPIMIDDDKHSEFSPSGSSRWISCPASIALSRCFPKVEKPSGNIYAEEGTAAHELAAFVLKNPDIEVSSQLGKKFNNQFVTRDMINAVDEYIKYIDSAMQIDTEMWIETKIPLFYIAEDQHGTADCVLLFNENTSKWVIEIIDYKHGQGNVVEVENNTQLRTYACGVLEYLAKHKIRFSEFDTIKLTIVQPRAPHANGSIRSEFVNIKSLREHKQICKNAVRLANSDDPPFNPSEETCLWCEVKPVCKSFAKFNIEMARIEFDDIINAEDDKDFSNKLFVIDNTISNKELLAIYNKINCFSKWLLSIKEYVHDQMVLGKKIPGLKVVRGRSNRQWENEEELLTKFEMLVEWSEELDLQLEYGDIFNRKLKSPAQVEKTLDKDIVGMLKPLIFKPDGAPSVANENDPRPAIDMAQEAIKEWDL